MSTGTCVKCSLEYNRKWRQRNPDYARDHYIRNRDSILKAQAAYREQNQEYYAEYASHYRKENKEKIREKYRKRYAENREAERRRGQDYYKRNKDSEKERNRRWRNNNRGKYNAIAANRRSAKLQRTPAWADHDAIARVYAQAKLAEAVTGLSYHVDHIVPLQGENVSGLHVSWNLQILEAEDNISKGNKLK